MNPPLSTSISRPILYSFRRCPYAMRARLVLAACNQPVRLREIVLRNKPTEMLAISAKGTVPVMQLHDGTVLEESLDIMLWAINQQNREQWLPAIWESEIMVLITRNDIEFKPWLDRYKYADRYPEHTPQHYRNQVLLWLQALEQRLQQHAGHLVCSHVTLADLALLPFVRQCAHVDLDWFDHQSLPLVQRWLADFKASPLFLRIMQKYPAWQSGEAEVDFPPCELD